jgi:uncharacterized protein (TIGR03067 family)
MGKDLSRTHDVFLSYSSKDKIWADAACAGLEQERIRCWIAPRDMTPGDEWGAGIIKGLNTSRVFVLIFSDHANASKQVRKEVERAISKELPVLAFRIQNVEPKDAMEFNLSNIHWLDAFNPPVERQLEVLARSVRMLLDNEARAARGPEGSGDKAPENGSGVGPTPPVSDPSPVRGRTLIAGALAGLAVIIVAGLFAMFGGRTVPPIPEPPVRGDKVVRPVAAPAESGDKSVLQVAETAPLADQERIQGRWQSIEAVHDKTRKKASELPWVWVFRGRQLTILFPRRGEGHGSFSLSVGDKRKFFDYVGTNPEGKPTKIIGIYEFDGEFLEFCLRYSLDPSDQRPDSFEVEPGSQKHYHKFRRLGDR